MKSCVGVHELVKKMGRKMLIFICVSIALLSFTACDSGITSNYSGKDNQKGYEGQQIEFDGFYFNIPDDYTSLDDISGLEEDDSEEHVKIWVYGSDIGCMIALMSGVEADTNADEFKTNAREFADGFSNSMVNSKSADIDYRDTSVCGMWALEANYAGLSEFTGNECKIKNVFFFDESSDRLFMAAAIQDKNTDNQNTLSDFDKIIASCRRADSSSKSASSAADELSSANTNVVKEENTKPLEIVDTWSGVSTSFGDSSYVEFAAIIRNPNNNYTAEFPKLNVTVENSDGTVLGTTETMDSTILPNDNIVITGMLTISKLSGTESAKVSYNVECSDFVKDSIYGGIRSSYFVASNVTENGSNITGKISNNGSDDADLAKVTLILRKKGKIVYAESTFLDIAGGQTKAFQFQSYDGYPQHDEIEIMTHQ